MLKISPVGRFDIIRILWKIKFLFMEYKILWKIKFLKVKQTIVLVELRPVNLSDEVTTIFVFVIYFLKIKFFVSSKQTK